MTILILNQAFYPDVVSTAQHASDLAIALTRAGHKVTVLCNSRGYDDRTLRFQNREVWNGIDIVRVPSTGFGKNSKWRRACDFGTFLVGSAYRLWSGRHVDVMVAMTSPPLISYIASLAVPSRARSLVLWVMDLNPDEAIAAGWLRDGSLIARLLSRLLLHSFKRADRIIALDRFMKERIESKGIPSEKIAVVPPWAHNDQVKFDPAGREEFRAERNLSDKFVVMYSGNHSPCHPLETLLRAAEGLVDHKEIIFCFVGGGSEFRKVQERSQNRGMHNVLCIPYQPIERLSASLSAADLQVVIVGNAYIGIVHPCKIYNVLAANRAFLYIGPAESHVQDIIRLDGTRAYISAHGDVDGVMANILSAARRNKTLSPFTVEAAKQFSNAVLIPQMISLIEESGSLTRRAEL